MEVLGGVAALDLVGHVDVCGFGLTVGGPGVVGAFFLEVEVLELDPGAAVAGGGDVDDAGAEFGSGGVEEGVFEELEEEEVSKVVGSELGFEAICCFALGCCHDSGVVDQDVKSVGFREEGFRAVAY